MNEDFAAAIEGVLPASRVDVPGIVAGVETDYTYDTYAFHFGLSDAFTHMNDFHLNYEPPFEGFAFARPLAPWPEADADGNMIFKLRRTQWDGVGYAEVHGEGIPDASLYEGKVVSLVNGEPVDEYVRAIADQIGGFHSPGQRLNYMLAKWFYTGVTKLGGFESR